MAVAFDTLTYARRLREVGVPQEQAEAHAEALAAAVTGTLATKEDLGATTRELKRDIQELASTTKHDLQELAFTTKQDLRELELRLSLRLGGMLGVGVAIVATLVKLL